MGRYKINFSGSDVFSRIEDLVSQSSLGFLDILQHELLGGFGLFADRTNAFLSDNVRMIASRGELPNPNQLGYVKETKRAAKKVDEVIENLIGAMRETKVCQLKDCDDLADAIKSLSQYFPTAQKISSPENIDPKRLEKLQEIDAHLSSTFYAYNSMFSPEFNTGSFNLKEDVRKYFIFRESKQNNYSCKMGVPNIKLVETKVDYFSSVILPLIRNIEEHAFDPTNDITGKLNDDTKLERIFSIFSNSPKEFSGFISVAVRDYGVGIKPEVYANLFERGTTRKSDTPREHGIGLWGIKRFVEENGGTIRCETELGKETTFTFTIPYISEVKGVYKHQLPTCT